MTTPFPTKIDSTDLAIETRGLQRRYGSRLVLDDVSIQVPAGAVYLLVGPNGAGKSTTIKVLLDLIDATAGAVSVLGLETRKNAERVRANVGYVPERTDWGYGWMRVDQLLAHHRTYFSSWDADYATRLSKLFRLRESSRLSSLSKGEARRVHLVMALAHRPPVLILDEPTDGLDPLMRDEMLGVLVDHIAETPTTVLLSTHRVEEVERIADHIAVLNDGVLQAQLPIEVLREQLNVYRAIVPDGWQGTASLQSAVVQRVDAPREIQWTIWGDRLHVTQQLGSAQANVTDVRSLSLLDATLCLLKSRGESHDRA
jgi:ABC-2 type transport system ATP-binding protein